MHQHFGTLQRKWNRQFPRPFIRQAWKMGSGNTTNLTSTIVPKPCSHCSQISSHCSQISSHCSQISSSNSGYSKTSVCTMRGCALLWMIVRVCPLGVLTPYNVSVLYYKHHELLCALGKQNWCRRVMTGKYTLEYLCIVLQTSCNSPQTIVCCRKAKFLSQGRQIVMSSTLNKWNSPIIPPRGMKLRD